MHDADLEGKGAEKKKNAWGSWVLGFHMLSSARLFSYTQQLQFLLMNRT